MSSEYVELHLINPAKIHSLGAQAAKVLTIGALLEGTLFRDGKRGMTVPRSVNAAIRVMCHEVEDREKLRARASVSGAGQLFFCSLCGLRLGAHACTYCKQSYPPVDAFAHIQLVSIPPKILSYIRSLGHTFRS